MCFAAAAPFFAGASQGLLQGLSALSSGRYQAAVARHEGRQAKLAADQRASEIERQGTQELGALRRAGASSGNESWLDFLADRASTLAYDVAWTKMGGQVARAEARARSAYARQQGWQGFIGALPGTATDLLRGVYAIEAQSASGVGSPPPITVRRGRGT